MVYTTIISPIDLLNEIENPNWIIIDCRFSLADTEMGRRDYNRSHIPNAVYAHLDEDLSNKIVLGRTSRHPLPEVKTIVKKFSSWGIDSKVQVVTYDDAGGALAASRLWWMLRWLGHEKVAVLDGGWQNWLSSGFQTNDDINPITPRKFVPDIQSDMLVSTEDVNSLRLDPDYRLIDARALERYQGKNEPIDPVAGHIPGDINAPHAANLTPQGTFLTKKELASYYSDLLEGIPPQFSIHYCGSGVTSILNILAMEYAELIGAKLYAGSWSEWITNPNRPVATIKLP
jgi:thiosulfate/3-mercaptopyruvate sulfurtransferase